MGFIDCDAHVLENDETWDFMDPSERRYRPRTLQFVAEDSAASAVQRQLWVVDDAWSTRMPGQGYHDGGLNKYDGRSTMFTDPDVRVQDLDALGIDFQVVHSTFFVAHELWHPLAEAAIMRGYNRWVAARTADVRDRVGWTLNMPTRLIERGLAELEFGKANGAVGVHIRGIEQGQYLSDPYFYPLYARAEELELPICVHVGAAMRRVVNQTIGQVVPTPEFIIHHIAYLMAGFHALISSDLHERFPRLRWAFMEGGASWAPAVLKQAARMQNLHFPNRPDVIATAQRRFGDMLQQRRLYLTVEMDEDLPYLVDVLGDRSLITGTDYGHNDVGTDIYAHSHIVNNAGLGEEDARRIVDLNARELFGIPSDFRPSDGKQLDAARFVTVGAS